MSISKDNTDSTSLSNIDNGPDAVSGLSHVPSLRASRAYQLEMLQKSLDENVIVAMDTGSGKTQIAILRIRAQLESSLGQKIIWFLAPTVLLCAQQVDAIQFEIPSASIRLVVGSDNVHTWGASTWKSLLTGTQVVVSTYQVLLDALDHAFVKLNRISLLIFDEAHNCVGSNPGGRIMTHFYHYERQRQDANNGTCLPAILGLTATPSMRAHVTGLEQLENLLNAKCISPSVHREELLRHVKRPQLRVVQCETCTTEKYTESIISLRREYEKMNILEDPYVIFLRAQSTERSIRDLEKVITKQKTWSRIQLSSLLSRSINIQEQLGSWAANLYIWKCKYSFLQSLQPADVGFESWIPEEKHYVAKALRDVTALEPAARPMGLDSISDRVQLLLRELLACQDSVVGIIFVKERVTAAMLAALLGSVPKIRERYRVGCMVGTSQNQFRKRALYEFFDAHDLRTLHDFREGKINLLVATSVLEEGIDVPACNLVMCFDSPPTPKSFIQRRGRARMHDSELLLFTDRDTSLIDKWATFEEVITKLCQDTERERHELEALEDADEDMDFSFRVAHTGARLDHDNAKQHLEHFCRVISPGQYTDGRPDYIVNRVEGTSVPLVSAEVILPASLPPKLRRIQSSRSWKSERNAMKDAAFQAYMSLYNAGLVNKHLLPLETDEDFGVETRAAIVGVEALYDPWPEVVSSWGKEESRWVYTVQVQGADDALFGDYSMTLPIDLGTLVPIQLYLDYNTTYTLVFSPPRRISVVESDQMADHTSALIGLHFCHRWPMEEAPHVIKFTSHDDSFGIGGIGNRSFDATTSPAESVNYLVRDHGKAPCRYIGEISSKPSISLVQRPFRDFEDAPDELYLNLSKWSRRTDCLHPMKVDPETQIGSQKKYACVLPISYATMDSIHIKHARFGMIIPSIIHTVETMLTARELSATLLKPLGISNYLLLKDAISARSASEPTHYERLEFLGDSILKYCTSIQAAATNLDWSEGYLSRYKDRLVANSRLSRAALETGLSRYILTIPFTGQKWRPFYMDAVVQGNMKKTPKRNLSTKVLADVVEALIGVSYTVGGIPKAIQCLSVFINECSWEDPSDCRDEFFTVASSYCPPCSHLQPLEELLGYSFKKKSVLLEATTHSSYIGDTSGRSWERLEFIGDAVLDIIIVSKLINSSPPLSHSKMHMIKTAMVNKDFLAFISLEEHVLSQTQSTVLDDNVVLTEKKRSALWRYIRHSSNGIGPAQVETAKRHQNIRQDIIHAIHYSDHYPWSILTCLHASKFYSDLMEALVGAIWVDSGSLAQCEVFLSRCGMMSYLDRILDGGVHMQHPKEELGKLAKARSIIYNIEQVKSGDDGKEYNCKLVIGGRQMGEARGGLTAEEVRVKAATEAVALLKREAEFPVDVEMVED